jgi:nicotinamide-nucleotide amidase
MNAALAQCAGRVLEEAKARHLSLVTAESCTAGALAVLLANAPGAAESFHGGFVCYTKAQKFAALAVAPELIETHTAVSREVAVAMARGGIDRSPADVCVAITGVAGPEPDEDGNPVGLMHVAVACRDGRVASVEHSFGENSRERNRELALKAALDVLDAIVREAESTPSEPSHP